MLDEARRCPKCGHAENQINKGYPFGNAAPEARKYCTDGYGGYVNFACPGRHVRNIHDKKDTYTVESINADLRHYIPLLACRSRCFAHKPDTLSAVAAVFADVYNRFGSAKYRYRQHHTGEIPFSLVDFL